MLDPDKVKVLTSIVNVLSFSLSTDFGLVEIGLGPVVRTLSLTSGQWRMV